MAQIEWIPESIYTANALCKKYFDELEGHKSLSKIFAINEDISLSDNEFKAWIEMVNRAEDCFMLSISYSVYKSARYGYDKKCGFISKENTFLADFCNIVNRIVAYRFSDNHFDKCVKRGLISQGECDFLKSILHGSDSFTEMEQEFRQELLNLISDETYHYIESIRCKESKLI